VLRLLLILLLSLPLIACSTCSAPSVPDKPEEAVKAYFSALEKSDCKALRNAAGAELGKRIDKNCDAALDDYRKQGLRLVRIEGVTPDGRNPEVMLVRVVVLRDGKQAPVILRVEKESGRWKLASL
jgi:hypothetical protein